MISVQSVSKFYGDFKAVNKISFTVKRGEITGLLGPNGAGKTTILRMLTGYFEADDGRITVDGLDAREESLAVREKIGYLPESAPLYDDMIVFDYLSYIGSVRSVDNYGGRIGTMAATCGIVDVMHKTIGELSKGYRQRVGLAQALIHDPEILILDEPTSGLDPNQIVEIRSLIKEIGRTKTVILSTHILSEVEALCDQVIIINRGDLVAHDRTGNLRAIAGDTDSITVQITGPAPGEARDALMSIEDIVSCDVGDSEELISLTATARPGSDCRPDIFALVCRKGWVLYELSRQSRSLENIFRQLTEGGSHE